MVLMRGTNMRTTVPICFPRARAIHNAPTLLEHTVSFSSSGFAFVSLDGYFLRAGSERNAREWPA